MAVFSSKKTLTKVICLLIILALGLAGCGKKVTEPLTKDNLTGKRLAVMAGYSSDYLMSKSPYNFDIYRYDTYADMQMALRFHRVDAIAMESDEAHVICRLKPIYKVGLVVQDNVEYAYMFNSDRPELRKQFNQFIKEFKQTAEYADLLKRVEAAADKPWQAKKIENKVTTDRVIKVIAFDGWEPVSYINASTGKWEGCDIELVTHFANSLGARVEINDRSWNQMMIELFNGMADLVLSPDSLLMAKDLQMNGNITMSDPVYLKDIVLIVNREE